MKAKHIVMIWAVSFVIMLITSSNWAIMVFPTIVFLIASLYISKNSERMLNELEIEDKDDTFR